jgi:aminomethyltransferase
VWVEDQAVGEITSGTFSPTLQQSIALARVKADAKADVKIGDTLQIAVRNKKLDAVVARYPFVKNGVATN